jgi:hypothetical protein
MRERLIAWGGRLLLAALLRRAPPIDVDATKFSAFAGLATEVMGGRGEVVAYNLPYPKHAFAYYLVTQHEVLLHGTSRLDVEEFVPKQQTDYRGSRGWLSLRRMIVSGRSSSRRFTESVPKARFRCETRRWWWARPDSAPVPLFSVNRELHAAASSARRDHVLPRETFQRTDNRPVFFPEWISEVPVQPLARLDVNPETSRSTDESRAPSGRVVPAHVAAVPLADPAGLVSDRDRVCPGHRGPQPSGTRLSVGLCGGDSHHLWRAGERRTS